MNGFKMFLKKLNRLLHNLCKGFNLEALLSSSVKTSIKYVLELVILENVDNCAPLVDVKENWTVGMTKIPSSIKNKLNVRKRLLRIDPIRSTNVNAPCIRALNDEIKSFFSIARATSVRRAAMGSNVNLWKAVKVAKNLNSGSIPTNFFFFFFVG